MGKEEGDENISLNIYITERKDPLNTPANVSPQLFFNITGIC